LELGFFCGERATGMEQAKANVTDIAIASLLCWCYRETHHTNNTICWILHKDTSLNIGATPQSQHKMSTTITACKFVGTVSLGLLTVRLIANRAPAPSMHAVIN
jgi:hypothetical protein